ncbi:MAG: GIY-YIG nuclease family protein [Ignavibacteriae bacterium]|nr:GIY-YIG nuclease family protein [Ignavibacteriota bacterium]
MKYAVYILRSIKTGKYYIGQTQNLEDRLARHNSGHSFSTRHGKPWEIIHIEKYDTRSDAVKRERYLKSPAGWKELQEIKQSKNSIC